MIRLSHLLEKLIKEELPVGNITDSLQIIIPNNFLEENTIALISPSKMCCKFKP